MRTPAFVAAMSLLAALTGCSDNSADLGPRDLVLAAKATLEATPSVHFTLTSKDLPDGGTALLGGEGDLERPDRFKGTLRVRQSGITVSIDVLSRDGVFYVKLPFGAGYTDADPDKYGFADPGALLDPAEGLTGLLDEVTEESAAGSSRLGDEVVDNVDVSISGAAVERALASADPAQPVTGRLSITRAEPRELRQAVLTGPFLDREVKTTFTIVLDRYGEPVDISGP